MTAIIGTIMPWLVGGAVVLALSLGAVQLFSRQQRELGEKANEDEHQSNEIKLRKAQLKRARKARPTLDMLRRSARRNAGLPDDTEDS